MKNPKRKSLWTIIVSLLVGTSSCTEAEPQGQDDQPNISDQVEAMEYGNNYGGELIPINTAEYSRYLLAENTSKEYVLSSITEYGELSGGTDFTEFDFGIFEYSEWILVKIPDNFGFYQFHNLVGWLLGYDQEAKLPSMTYGIAAHNSDSTKNYFVELDQNTPEGDVVVGAFQNGNSYYVYLPEAYEENGNMKITNQINYDYNAVKNKFSELSLPFDSFDSRSYESHLVKYYE